MSETPTELALREAVTNMIAENPGRVLPAVAAVLEQHGVRCLAVAIGVAEKPQVVITATIDDVTRETVTQVTRPVLIRVGFPEDVVPIMAGAAGSAVARAITAQRVKRQQQQAAEAAVAAQQPPIPSPTPMPSGPRPAWVPGPRRGG